MPVVQPYLKPFVGEGLLNNDVGCAVLIDVERRQRQSCLIGLEGEFIVLASGDVELNPKELLTVEIAGIQEAQRRLAFGRCQNLPQQICAQKNLEAALDCARPLTQHLPSRPAPTKRGQRGKVRSGR